MAMAIELGQDAVRQPADDCQERFEELYRQYHRRVRGFIRRKVPDAHLVDDVTQETFLRIYRSIDNMDPDRDPWPWLAKVAENASVDTLRRRRPVEQLHDAEEAGGRHRASSNDDPAERFAARQRSQGIATAMDAVCPRQRRMLMLRETEGWRYEDIAELEGVTLNALKSALKRARKNFRDAYATVAEERGLWGAALAPVFAAGRRVRNAMNKVDAQIGIAVANVTSALSANVASLAVAAGMATVSAGLVGAPLNAHLADAARAPSAAAVALGEPGRASASTPAPDSAPVPYNRHVGLSMRSDQLTGTQTATAGSDPGLSANEDQVALIATISPAFPGHPEAPYGLEVYVECGDPQGAMVCSAVRGAPGFK